MRTFLLLPATCLLWLLAGRGPLAAQPAVHFTPRYWEAPADSLRRVLATQRADTARLRTLRHLVDVNEFEDLFFQDARMAAEVAEVVALTKRLHHPAHRAYRLLLAVQRGRRAGATSSAGYDSLQAAIAGFDRLGWPVPWLVNSVAVGNAVQERGTKRRYYESKLARYRQRGDSVSVAACLSALGGYHKARGDYNQAIGYFLRASRLWTHVRRDGYYSTLSTVGICYAGWGNNYKALHYLQQALGPAGRPHAGAYLYTNLTLVYLRLRNYPAALRAADQALSVATGDRPSTAPEYALALVTKSRALLAMGRVNETGPLLRRAQALAEEASLPLAGDAGDFELDATWARYHTARREAAQAETAWLAAYRKARQGRNNTLRLAYLGELARFYQGRAQAGPAAQYALAAVDLADTLRSAQGAMQVAQFETEQADLAQTARIQRLRRSQVQEAARARRQRGVLGAVLAALALIGGCSFLLWRSNRRQQRANTLLQQQKAEIQAQRDQTAQALTELRATQAQLIQKEKMASLGELTAGIAHEIQNPLNFVNNFSEVSTELMAELQDAHAAGDAAEVAALAGDVTQNLGKITEHGKRAAAIVKGMLEHSRASTGERAPTDLNALADEYLRLAYQGLRAKDNTFHAALTTDFASELPLVEAVGADVGRVLLNLLGNAFYAVRQRQQTGEADYAPTVRVQTQQVGQQVEIRVTDNGTGMPAAVQAKIFQPFFTTKPTGEGTGLGLSLAHDIIIQGHGGSLTVKSQQGQGTTFSVALPLNGANHQPAT